jgi:hypothetical protein
VFRSSKTILPIQKYCADDREGRGKEGEIPESQYHKRALFLRLSQQYSSADFSVRVKNRSGGLFVLRSGITADAFAAAPRLIDFWAGAYRDGASHARHRPVDNFAASRLRHTRASKFCRLGFRNGAWGRFMKSVAEYRYGRRMLQMGTGRAH